MMPGLFALGQHPALAEVQSSLQNGEAVSAFLDDMYIICGPDRVVFLFRLAQETLWKHARIEVNLRKTKVWNAGGVEPAEVRELGGSEADPVWVGGQNP